MSAPDSSGPGTFAAWVAGQEERPSNHYHSCALVIKYFRTASAELRTRGYMCDRITHTEVMTSEGTQYLGGLLSGDYRLLWVATPADWYVRLPGKRAGPHYQRIQNIMVKARALRMSVVLMGPLGPIRDSIEDLGLQTMRMRCCHFGIKFDRDSSKPSGSYIHIATTCTRIPVHLWKCNCGVAGKQ